MRYSILMPYYKRPQLKSTLMSFQHHYGGKRSDYEIVIIEDIKNKNDPKLHAQLGEIIKAVHYPIRVAVDEYKSWCPAKKYNIGFAKSTGDILVLTNPECMHENNVLGVLDKMNPDAYDVCSCKSGIFEHPVFRSWEDSKKYRIEMWYQHGLRNNRQFHFCSAISRYNYAKIGGFDERYADGVAYDDNSFLERVRRSKIPITSNDAAVVVHINHDRRHTFNADLVAKNQNLWRKQLRTGDFFTGPLIDPLNSDQKYEDKPVNVLPQVHLPKPVPVETLSTTVSVSSGGNIHNPHPERTPRL